MAAQDIEYVELYTSDYAVRCRLLRIVLRVYAGWRNPWTTAAARRCCGMGPCSWS